MKIIRVGQVAEKIGRSISGTWKCAAEDPEFPKPVKFSGITGWVDEEVDGYLVRKVADARAKQATPRASVVKAAAASAKNRAGVA